METTPTTPPGVASSTPPPGPFQPALVPAPHSSQPKSTPEERERWRRKAQLARARKLAAAGQGTPGEVERLERELGGGSVGSPGPAGTDQVPLPGVVAPVPWDPGILRPLFESIVPELEKLSVASLRAKAAAIDAGLAKTVEHDAQWNPVAKATVTTTGPQVVAQVMNSAGVSAEHAPAIALATAVVSILAGHKLLAKKLDEMAAKPATPSPANPSSSGPPRE